MAGALSAGSYTVTVTDANGCTETQSVTVLEPTVLTSTVSSMDALCNGSSDGSATVTSVEEQLHILTYGMMDRQQQWQEHYQLEVTR